jgi:hypothetical protein
MTTADSFNAKSLEDRIREAEELGDTEEEVIEDYYKYVFTVEFKAGGRKFRIDVGGDANDIYKLEPCGGWYEWHAAEIRNLLELPE